MENSSKALLMAAEVLVGVLLLTLMASLFYMATNYQAEVNKNLNAREINNFNAKFLAYIDTELTAQDVVTIYNIANDYNEKNKEINDQYLIKVTGITINSISDFLNTNTKTKYQIVKIDYALNKKINKIVIQEK